MKKYFLYGSLITGWNWSAPDRLVIEVELANYNQEDYTEDMDDLREIILIFEGCTLIDELNEGFNGFSSSYAKILDENEVEESTLPTARKGMKLAMDYVNYNGKGRKFVLITIFADEVAVIDPKKPA